MTDPGSFDPFKGIPFLGDLAKMMGGQGPISWEAARQLAVTIAADGADPGNVDPLERIRFEELSRVAELQVQQTTGLSSSGLLRFVPVSPAEWATRSLEAYKPLFERLAGALAPGTATTEDVVGEDAMMQGLLAMLSPMMLGMSAGSMVGHLAKRSFGQYDLPIPRRSDQELLVIPQNVNRFAADWSIPSDDVRLWLCLQEVTHHLLLAVPHLRAALTELIESFIGGFRPNRHALTDQLESMNPDDMSPGAIQGLFGDPQLLLGAMRTSEQDQVAIRLDALVALIVGYVDHVMDTVGEQLIGSYQSLSEALRRHRVEADEADVFVAKLLGLSLGQAQVDRGHRFVAGILERAGHDGLARLWTSARELPTPAELDAPGLWLARIDLPE